MPSDAPERVFLWFREPAHPIAFSQPQVDDKGDPWPEYVRADLLAARDADLTAAREALRLAVRAIAAWVHMGSLLDGKKAVDDYDKRAIRAALQFVPDALDGAAAWIVEAVKQEKPDA